MIEFKLMSSLSKIYPDFDYSEEKGNDISICDGTMLLDDEYSFQIVYRENEAVQSATLAYVNSNDDALNKCISVRYVDYVPCDLTVLPGFEEVAEHPAPGLMPDLLRPVPKTLWAYRNSFRALWVTINTKNSEIKPGKYNITVTMANSTMSKEFGLEILDYKLPKQILPVTNWFHSDCLCHYYKVDYLSEEYWRIAENYVKTAVANGINTLLTSIFTPPLDTDPDGERLTTQLVKVTVTNGAYSFEFCDLGRWIDMCLNCGVSYFEISHLFTQWGCRFAPKIMATVDNTYKRLFEKTEPGYGDVYKAFLREFLPQLVAFLKQKNVFDKCFFHISDEPNKDVLDNYRMCVELVKEYIPLDMIIDAMSDTDFVTEGLIKNPVASISVVDNFIKKNIDTAWGYYCCGNVRSANRFVACSSRRNRILGLQLFKYNLKGFLQWGYNFYNSFLSRESIDPYATSTALGWVPGGDPFVVYPAPDETPYESLRIKVFNEALSDYRALTALLDKGYDREELARELGFDVLPFENFDENGYDFLEIRNKVNRMLVK